MCVEKLEDKSGLFFVYKYVFVCKVIYIVKME